MTSHNLEVLLVRGMEEDGNWEIIVVSAAITNAFG